MPKGFQKGNAFLSRAPKGALIIFKAPKSLPPNEGCDMCDKLLFLCTFCAAAVTTPRFCRAVPGIFGSFHQGIRGRNTMPAKRTRCLSTNKKCKIVGDSPVCRALDSDGFADIKAAIMACSSYTSTLSVGDALRLNLGTPNEVLRSIERAFAVS